MMTFMEKSSFCCEMMNFYWTVTNVTKCCLFSFSSCNIFSGNVSFLQHFNKKCSQNRCKNNRFFYNFELIGVWISVTNDRWLFSSSFSQKHIFSNYFRHKHDFVKPESEAVILLFQLCLTCPPSGRHGNHVRCGTPSPCRAAAHIAAPRWCLILRLSSRPPAATLHGGVHDAPAGDGWVPEEVQRQEEAEGVEVALIHHLLNTPTTINMFSDITDSL